MSLLLSAALLAPPACVPADLEKVAAALAQSPARVAHSMALVGVAEACALPPALAEGIRDVTSAPPDQAAVFEARCISAAPELWVQACPAGLKVFSQLAAVAPAERPALLHAACQLDRYGLALPQLQAADVSPLGVLLAGVVHPHAAHAKGVIPALVISPRVEAKP